MPQTICSRCFAKLTPKQRQGGKVLCERCESDWEKKLADRTMAPAPANEAADRQQADPNKR